jgi:hypothetical protein
MEAVWYTVFGVGLYLVANWGLNRVEVARGKRFEHRSVIFFGLLSGLAVSTFWLVRMALGTS